MEAKIYLASSSPRRKELLKKCGLDFEVIVPDVSEDFDGDFSPEEIVELLAKRKAKAVSEVLSGQNLQQKSVIIAADTIVEIDGKILGKPKERADAVEILSNLSGRAHFVYTGICVLFLNYRIGDSNARLPDFTKISGEKIVSDVCKTKVIFRKLKLEEICDYVDTGEPLDKAGAYAIQGYGRNFVEKIEGEFDNVVGLPTEKLMKILAAVLAAE